MVALKRQEHSQVVKLLTILQNDYGIEFGDLTTLPEYAEFVKSPEYKEWLESQSPTP